MLSKKGLFILQRKGKEKMSDEKTLTLEDSIMALGMRISVIEKLLLSSGLLKEEDFTNELQKIVDHLQKMTELSSSSK